MRLFASLSVVVVAAVLFGSAGLAAAEEAPDALLRRVSQDFLRSGGGNQADDRAGRTRTLELIDSKMLPYVDLTEMTQLTAGRLWRSAMPNQRAHLVDRFRELLIVALAEEIYRARPQSVDVGSVAMAPDATNVMMPGRIVRRGGEPVSIIYRMQKEEPGWKITDVSIAGSWVSRSYQPLFASEAANGGIDGLVQTLTARDRQVSQGFLK